MNQREQAIKVLKKRLKDKNLTKSHRKILSLNLSRVEAEQALCDYSPIYEQSHSKEEF